MRIGERLLWLGGRFFHLLPANMTVRIPAGLNKGFRWVRGSANAPEWLGIYELSKQRAVGKLTAEGGTVFDVGANAGFYTLAFSRITGPAGRVVAFEPLGRNCAKILRHLALNRIGNVTLVQAAVSDSTDIVSFEPGENDFVGGIAAGSPYLIPALSLDDFVARRNLPDPDLVKIDVEGAEADVLRGSREILKRARPRILLALHGETAASDCFNILQSLNYTLRSLHGELIRSADVMPPEVIAMFDGPSEATGPAEESAPGKSNG